MQPRQPEAGSFAAREGGILVMICSPGAAWLFVFQPRQKIATITRVGCIS
jgi:hypothetical protein